jgi:hypothetical protein
MPHREIDDDGPAHRNAHDVHRDADVKRAEQLHKLLVKKIGVVARIRPVRPASAVEIVTKDAEARRR